MMPPLGMLDYVSYLCCLEMLSESGYLRDSGQHQEPEPRLRVNKSLENVIPFPNSGGYTHLVHTQSLDGNQLLISTQELGLHRRVRCEYEDKYGYNYGKKSTEEKDDLIRVQKV